ncbi:MAG: response regulator, partial [Rubrivivax sp.]|nr:response regulator [Rubrivivax sp.]
GGAVPPAPASVAGPASQPAAQAAAREHEVLYIEDNEVNRLLMEGMLAQRPGIRLRMAAAPQQGLQMAAERPPDLVLLDIQLPDFDGFEVLRRLRQQEARNGRAPAPVVAVSANAMPADRDKAMRAGFADYITKPIDLPLLLAAVDRLLGR